MQSIYIRKILSVPISVLFHFLMDIEKRETGGPVGDEIVYAREDFKTPSVVTLSRQT